jgi:Spy/CpxP family protein refolding chaperone
MKLKTIAVVVGSLFLVSGLAMAAGAAMAHKPERMRQMMNWKVDDSLDAISANDQQRATAHALANQLFDDGMKLHQTREQIRAELMQQWKSDHPDANAVHADVDKMVDALRAFAHEAADDALKMHDQLSPEQRNTLAQRAEEKHAHWGH